MVASTPLALVISPQPWSGFQVSKHHYARALAGRGWRVVFVDPPADLGRPGRIEQDRTEVPGLTRLRYQPFFPYRLKFHARPLFDLLMRRQARRLVAATGRPALVWDFDNAYQFRDLRPFGARCSLFHLVDDVAVPGLGTKRADHVLFLHPSYCTHAGGTPQPDHYIPVGLGQAHAALARATQGCESPLGAAASDRVPHVAFVGNLAAPWLDWAAVLEMARRHPGARFTLWGPVPQPPQLDPDLAQLSALPHVALPGLTPPEEIVAAADTVDVWLAPILSERKPGGSLDAHKIMEYLATGKVILSSWVAAYEGDEMLVMAPRDQPGRLPDLLDAVLADLDRHNTPDLMQRRRSYALSRSYECHLDRILEMAGANRTVGGGG